jgi:hypothetical protein
MGGKRKNMVSPILQKQRSLNPARLRSVEDSLGFLKNILFPC